MCKKCKATIITTDFFPQELALVLFAGEDSDNNINDTTIDFIKEQIDACNDRITCIGFFGYDDCISNIVKFAEEIHKQYNKLKIGLYSEKEVFPFKHGVFDYIKLGAYDCPISNPESKQRYYVNIDSGGINEEKYINAVFADRTDALWREKSILDEDYFEEEEKHERHRRRAEIFNNLNK